MRVTLIAAALIFCAATATTASADVTLQYGTTGQGPVTEAMGTTEYRKGLKMRTDVTSGDSFIIDLGTPIPDSMFEIPAGYRVITR
jgi:hypothetical protein